jgi:hypothetical protein
VRWIGVRFVVLLLAACTSAAPPAFSPRPASRSMTTATLRIEQNGRYIEAVDRATGRSAVTVVGELVGTLGDSAVALIEVEMRTRIAAYAPGRKFPFISDEIPFEIAENGCLLAVEAAPGEVRLGFGSSHAQCDHRAEVQHWVAVDLRTRHVRVVSEPQLAF